MKLPTGAKIAIGWSVIIAVGLYSFVVARDSVIKNRKVIMEVRRKSREQAQREAEEQFANKAQSGQIDETASS